MAASTFDKPQCRVRLRGRGKRPALREGAPAVGGEFVARRISTIIGATPAPPEATILQKSDKILPPECFGISDPFTLEATHEGAIELLSVGVSGRSTTVEAICSFPLHSLSLFRSFL